jgi:hypothetical protein
LTPPASSRVHLTLFHELVHASGAKKRLNRKTLVENNGFGSKVYSKEELVAEMGAAFVGLEADIVADRPRTVRRVSPGLAPSTSRTGSQKLDRRARQPGDKSGSVHSGNQQSAEAVPA